MSGYLRKVIFGIICLIAIGGLFLGFRSHEEDTNNIDKMINKYNLFRNLSFYSKVSFFNIIIVIKILVNDIK